MRLCCSLSVALARKRLTPTHCRNRRLEEHRDEMFKSTLLECSSSLTHFHFCSGSQNRHPNERLDNMFNDGRLSLVEDIIISAKGLKRLELELRYCEIYRRSDAVMANMLRAVSTAGLTHLSLSRTDVSEAALLSFLLPFVQTLKDIIFLAVFLDDTLIQDGWSSILYAIQGCHTQNSCAYAMWVMPCPEQESTTQIFWTWIISDTAKS